MRASSTRKSVIAWAILATTAIPQLHAGRSRDEDAARLEFRILADPKHDPEAAAKARAAGGLEHPPDGYRWVSLGSVVKGTDARIESKRLIVAGAHWKENEFAGSTVRLKGKNLGGSELSKDFQIEGNAAESLQLRPDPAIFFKTVSSYRIDLTPSRLGESAEKLVIIREAPDGPGRVKQSVLVKLDRHNVSEKDLRRVFPDVDEHLNPAVRIEFSPAGGRKFGALTREHLPEEGGAFKYQLGIILDGLLMSAPVINSEIRDSGIIEGGPQGFKSNEVERIVKILRGSRKESN
jgi:SecD/SecF fusion protein